MSEEENRTPTAVEPEQVDAGMHALVRMLKVLFFLPAHPDYPGLCLSAFQRYVSG